MKLTQKNNIPFWSLFISSIVNSSGTWLLWLILGPYVSAYYQMSGLGVIAAGRQISGMLGSLFFGDLPDRSKNLRRSVIWMILVQIILNIWLYLLLKKNISIPYNYILTFTLVRFFISSIEFLYIFKIMGTMVVNWGNGSILHLITIQGSVVFASLMVMFLEFFNLVSLDVALVLDTISFLILFMFVVFFVENNLGFKAQENISLFKRFSRNFCIFFDRRFYPWNLIQILLLISCSGFVVSAINVSKKYPLFDNYSYAFLQCLYGAVFFMTGLIVLKIKQIEKVLFASSFLSFFYGSLDIFIVNGRLTYVVIFFLILNIGLIVHTTNKAISGLSSNEDSSMVRASSVVYLSLIFSLGELIFGYAIDSNYKEMANIFFRILPAILSILVLVNFNKKYRPG